LARTAREIDPADVHLRPAAHPQRQILFCGEDISHKSTHFVASGGIAQAPEGRRIFPDMTVEENLLMGTIPIGNQYAARICKACLTCSRA
jgi:ABC-type branched-subunit amino acid transport system ATPase component